MTRRPLLRLRDRKLRVEPYDPAWPVTFEQIRSEVAPLLDEIGAAIEHVGSTAIPSMVAKPILDIDFVAPAKADVAAMIDLLEKRGYRNKGNRGIVGREMFGNEIITQLDAQGCARIDTFADVNLTAAIT